MRQFTFRACIITALLLTVVPVLAQVGFVYTCDNTPDASPQPWNVSPNGPPSTNGTCNASCDGITNTIVAANNSNVWKLVEPSTANCGIWKNSYCSGMSLGTGATIAANIRCAANSADSSFTLGINKMNSSALFLCVRTDQCLLEDREGVVKQSASFAADSVGYHQYWLTAKDPLGVGDDLCVWNVYRDGQLLMTCQPGLLGNWNTSNAFFAGHGGPRTTNIGSGTGTWYFDWIACRTDGAFSPSQWDVFLPPIAPTVTAPSSGSTLVVPTPTIAWADKYFDAYEIHLNTTNNPAAAAAWSSTTSTTTSSLPNGTYYVFVRLRTAMGWGAWSAAGYSFTVDAPTSAPGPPTQTAPTAGSTFTRNSVVVAWTGGTRDSYETIVTTTNDPTGARAWDSGAVSNQSNNCLTGNLGNGHYYAFTRLHNLAGWGYWSASVDFTISVPPPGLPVAPTIVTPPDGVSVTLQKPVIRWIGDAHDSYEVHITSANSPTGPIVWNSGQPTSADDACDSGPLVNGSYYAFVRVHNVAGWGPWSAGRPFAVAYTGAQLKKGWILLRDELPYTLDLLTHAREYHVNQVQISHDIMMYAYQPINDTSKRAQVNQIIDTAHANGVTEVVLWTHDIMYANLPSAYRVGGKVNLDDPGFWTWLDGQYEQLFTVCPNADGIVWTPSECDADLDGRALITHTGKTPEDTFAQAIQTIWNVCKRHNKSMYVRTWITAGVDRMVRNAVLRNDPQIWMMSKATGAGDWNVIQEDYDIIGTATGHPELVEFDVNGEYWNYTYTPWSGVEYLRHLWSDFALPRGAKGAVARIDHNDQSAYPGIHPKAYECSDRVAMYALDALLDYPTSTTNDIFSWWSNHWFGKTAGSYVASANKRFFDITNGCAHSVSSNNLPLVYPVSSYVVQKDVKLSAGDLNAVKPILMSTSKFRAGVTDYDMFYTPLMNAASLQGISVPSTLFCNFSPAYSSEANPTCSATAVDATMGLNPSTIRVDYSTNGGANWTNYTNFTVVADGSSAEAFYIVANSVPFGQLCAGRNQVKFSATSLSGTPYSQVFTVRGKDNAYANLAGAVDSDGISHPQGGDGDTVGATAGGRPCRTLLTTSDVAFYFQTDDGYAYDQSPKTIYLQVDYYGSDGAITPYYDCIWRNDTWLPPVYLSGGSTWRTATWRLDDVDFGHRLNNGADFALYCGPAANMIYISAVRLSYAPPAGMLSAPTNLHAEIITPTSISLAWDAAPGATKYQICRNGGFTGWSTMPLFTESGLSPNTQYSYTVTAFDASGFTSCASAKKYSTTLPTPPTPTTVTSSPLPGSWNPSGSFNFTAVGGFGSSKAAYYQYVWDESPTHVWTGNEPTWPEIGNPQSSAGWSSWRPTSSPTSSTQWQLWEGSTTQRCMSEETAIENGVPTWTLDDQGRVQNTKAKISLWPTLPISRDTGVTVSARIRCVDEPSGWYNTSTNFGVNLADCPDTGVAITPDSVQLGGANGNSPWIGVDNGYSYHTYTITAKNATPGNNSTTVFNLYRDGAFLANITQPPTAFCQWPGPFFGHWRSDAMGGWAWQWIAWNNTGAYAPSDSTTLTVTATHPGAAYYMHMRSFNADGVPNGTASYGPYYSGDGSSAVAPVVTDDGDYTTPTAIHVKWSPAGTSVDHYEYAIGTAPGGNTVLPFTSAGALTEVTKQGLTLSQGTTYYVTVKGFVGPTVVTGYSDGIRVAPIATTIAAAKLMADNTPVTLCGKIVTGIFADCSYVQEPEGMGLKIITKGSPYIGDLGNTYDLAGIMTGSVGERALRVDTVIQQPSAAIIKPIVLPMSALGGSFFKNGLGQKAAKAYQWWVDQSTHKRVRTTNVEGVPGLSTTGLLATTYGRVTWVGGHTMYVDDGSGNDDYHDTKKDGPPGLRVDISPAITPPAVGSFVRLTGVVSTYDGKDALCRLLRIREDSDIYVFPGS